MLRDLPRLALLLSLAAPLPALAQKKPAPAPTPTYVRDWTNVCGGSTFTTCASVQLVVTGTNVELRVWNLSGGSLGGDAGAIIRNIALLNLGSVVASTSITTAGPYYTGSSQPYPFAVTTTNSNLAGTIELSKNSTQLPGVSTSANALMHGIASTCATQDGIPTGTRLWMTAADDPNCTAPTASTSGKNYVQFNFSVNQAFDPNLMNVQLGITSIDVSSPFVSSYAMFYATPEPATMVLLGSGLLGMGGVGLKRRRRRESDPPAET